MSKTIIVGGYGPGISNAVAEKFGKEGFAVALVGRSAEKLEAGVKALEAQGIEAAAFPTDLGDASAVRALVARAREKLGPIHVLHWNAYAAVAGDLLAADAATIRSVLDVPVVGLLTAIQEVLPDLRQNKATSAILVTNGGFGYVNPQVDAIAAQHGYMGLALGNAAKHKLVALLAEKLRPEGIYVGELVVMSSVKGTAWDQGNATLEATAIASKFWDLYTNRKDVFVEVA